MSNNKSEESPIKVVECITIDDTPIKQPPSKPKATILPSKVVECITMSKSRGDVDEESMDDAESMDASTWNSRVH